MIKIPPCDLPMVPLVPMVPLAAENVQGFLVTIGKNGTNSTIGSFTDFTIGKTPNVAILSMDSIYHTNISCSKASLLMGKSILILGQQQRHINLSNMPASF